VLDSQAGRFLSRWYALRVAAEPASSFSVRNETWLDRLKFIVEGKRPTRAYFRGT